MGLLLQTIASGLAMGAIYSIVAYGYSVVHGPTKIINFAQGQVVMVGALLGSTLLAKLEWPWICAALTIMVATGLLGAVTEFGIIVPTERKGTPYAWIVATFAWGLILENVSRKIWGDYELGVPAIKIPLVPNANNNISLGSVHLNTQQIVIVVVLVILSIVIARMFGTTMIGRKIRAVSWDRDACAVLGIEQRNIILFAWLLGAGLAGLGGVLVGPITGASVQMAFRLGINSFIALIIGGVDTLWGPLAGGLFLGIMEFLLGTYVSIMYRETFVLFTLVVVLLIRPFGLFGKPTERRV